MEGNNLKEGRVPGCREPVISPLSKADIPLYIKTGSDAYRDHYCHLWPGGDPWPYLTRNFTPELVHAELQNQHLRLWLVSCGGVAAGICKLDLGRDYGTMPSGSSIFLEKIYFKKPFTGQGLGSSLLHEIKGLGQKMGRRFLWLEAMQKGPALTFYRQRGFEIVGETQVPHPEVLESEKKMWVLALTL